MRIIDSRARLQTREMLRHWTDEIKPYFKDYIRLYKMDSRLHVVPVEEYIFNASQYNIEKIKNLIDRRKLFLKNNLLNQKPPTYSPAIYAISFDFCRLKYHYF